MNSNTKAKTIGCYLMFLLMTLSAAFKIFHFGPSVHFYVYPLQEAFLTAVPYIELIGGILYLIGAKKPIYRVYGGIVTIPVLIGAMASHIAFGWFNLWGGITESPFLILPSSIIFCLAVWVSYEPIKDFINSKSYKAT